MRSLPTRPPLMQKVYKQLATKTQAILQETSGKNRQQKARSTYEAARNCKWFEPIVEALRGLCGEGEFCMYCSANEPSQIEHYRPLAIFPERAMEYENYLWSCDVCNRRYKQNRFPPDTEKGEQILNPLDDNVWDYFFLDAQFGRLIKRVDPDSLDPLPRALSTCNVVGIDRETVQIRRQHRFRELRRCIESTLADFRNGQIALDVLRDEIASQRSLSFQPDVADYFLNGPGRKDEPFRSALIAVGERVP